MSCWYGIRGAVHRISGTSGTATVPAGAKVLQILAHSTAGGTIQIFNDANTVPLPAGAEWFVLAENHTGNQAPTGHNTIVFTTTDSYLVEYTDQ